LLFSFFVIFSIFLGLSVNGVELKCGYRVVSEYQVPGARCLVWRADLSLKTIGANFIFNVTQEERQKISEITFDDFGRVAHLPRSLFEDLPELIELEISRSDIRILRNNFFKPEFSKLLKLRLTRDNIQIIEENAFDQLTNLESIWLWDNEMRSLPAKLFKKNRQLKQIVLGSNKIKIIAPETFQYLNQLTLVDLRASECVDREIGCWDCDSKLNHTELEREQQPCYENHARSLNLLKEGENITLSFYYRQSRTKCMWVHGCFLRQVF
jgi:hypothetical protein